MFNYLNPFDNYTLPLGSWLQAGVDWLTQDFRPAFQAMRWPAAYILDWLQAALTSIPQLLFLLGLFLFAWQFAGIRKAIICTACMSFLGLIGIWQDTMITLALIITAVVFSIAVGLPLGIVAGRSDRAEALFRPILDIMQTLPAFVYLVPIVMLVGIGDVPGVIVTSVFAIPPIIRLTSLGIRSVPQSTVEAAYAFGSSDRQVLLKVQIPLAIVAIRTGINQTLMMALAMVTYASMIAVRGLGLLVLRGIGRLDMGLAGLGGIGIVLLAIVLDRLSQAFALSKRERQSWKNRGPIGAIIKLYSRIRSEVTS